MISNVVARSILNNVVFPDEVDPTYSYCLSKTKRKNAVLSRSEHYDVAAAIQIQSAWRGHRTRQKIKNIFGYQLSQKVATHSSAQSPDCLVKSRYKEYIRWCRDQGLDIKSSAVISFEDYCARVKSRYKEYLRWCREQGLDIKSSAVISFEDYCARIIQSWWKRLDVNRRRQEGSGRGGMHSSSSRNQEGSWRGGMHSSPSKNSAVGKCRRKLDPHSAAVIIQRGWRRHNDVRVYKFYRDLINFKGKGDPKLMLRCINPAEAKLLDRAAGAHVKFRLGGVTFPPNIYYKVFTLRPIVDLCAYSPRNYTAMAYKQKLPRDVHNHGQRAPPSNDKDNWYKRHENNGWRPVSDRIFLSTNPDPITVETAAKQKSFHFSKVKRKDELERKRKQKKIRWLKKMYQEGLLQTHKDLSATTTSAVQLAADQLMELSDTHPEVVGDEDIDDLLSWTNALNFDEYITDWHASASTAFSDMQGKGNQDPYELTLTART